MGSPLALSHQGRAASSLGRETMPSRVRGCLASGLGREVGVLARHIQAPQGTEAQNVLY